MSSHKHNLRLFIPAPRAFDKIRYHNQKHVAFVRKYCRKVYNQHHYRSFPIERSQHHEYYKQHLGELRQVTEKDLFWLQVIADSYRLLGDGTLFDSLQLFDTNH